MWHGLVYGISQLIQPDKPYHLIVVFTFCVGIADEVALLTRELQHTCAWEIFKTGAYMS